MTDTPSCSDMVFRLLQLPDEPTRVQVQAVLSNELALNLLAAENDPERVLIMGYVINQSQFFSPAVFEVAQKLMESMNTAQIGGSLTIRPGLQGPDGSPAPAPAKDRSELVHMIRLFIPRTTSLNQSKN